MVLIGGVDLCDKLVEVSWGLGGANRTDPVTGNVASILLTGSHSFPLGVDFQVLHPAGQALFTGWVDGVTIERNIAAVADQTRVSAGDSLAQVSRIPMPPSFEAPVEKLPARLDSLWVTIAQKWPGLVASARWPSLAGFTIDPALGEVPVTQLNTIRDALLASLAFAYQRGDGALVYGPWEAPTGLAGTADWLLDAGVNCGSHAELVRDSLDGIINHWTAGTDVNIYQTASVNVYGEQSYNVPDGVLADATGASFPITTAIADAMDDPADLASVDVTIADATVTVARAEPMDLASFDGVLYAITGIRQQAAFGGWTASIALDRNPWAVRGGTVGVGAFTLDLSPLSNAAHVLGPI